MRVLWFSNTPAMGEAYLRNNALVNGGWMKSLDKAIQNNVELYVAFYWPYKVLPFKYGATHYYPLYSGNIITENLKRKWFYSEKDTEDIQYFLSVIHEINPDIIHIHGTENPFACIIDNVDIPVVISIQGNLTVIKHKYFSGFEKKYLKYANNRIKKILDILFVERCWKSQYIHLGKKQKVEEKNLLKCRYVIGRTDWDRRITRIQAPNSQYFHVGEIMRDTFFFKQWRPHNNVKTIIHTTNGNTFYKGFETLCYALSLLTSINFNVLWRVAGVSKDSSIVKLTRKKLGDKFPSKSIELLGCLDEERLCDELLKADIYVMPSHIENSPNNLCEAMLLGMPCIAALAGGTSSVLEDKKEGIIIQDGDPWALAGAIVELVNNPQQAILYGQNARETAQKRHNKNKVVSELLQAYKSIIKK